MIGKEILKLHEKIDSFSDTFDPNLDDNHVFLMAESRGWKVVEAMMKGMIAQLLEPVEFDDSVPLDVRGAIGEARRLAIEQLRKVITSVESTRQAKNAEKKNEQEKEVGADVSGIPA